MSLHAAFSGVWVAITAASFLPSGAVRLAVSPDAPDHFELSERQRLEGFSRDLGDLFAAVAGITLAETGSPSRSRERRWALPRATLDPLAATHVLIVRAGPSAESPALELRLVDVGESGGLVWSARGGPGEDLLHLRRRVRTEVLDVLGLTEEASGHPDAVGPDAIEPDTYSDYVLARGLRDGRAQANVQRARDLLLAVTRSAPSFPPGFLSLADATLRLNREFRALDVETTIAHATRAVEAAVALDQRSSEAHRIRGDIASLRSSAGTGEDPLPEVPPAYDRALELEPENRQALAGRGRALLRRREYANATVALERALALDPGDIAVRFDLAGSLRRQGYLDAARRQYLELLAWDPRHERALIQLGYLERQAGRLDRAVTWFERAAAVTGHWYNFIRLAVTYTDLGDLHRMDRAADAIGGSVFEDALREAVKVVFRGDYGALLAIAEARLGEGQDDIWRSWAAGAALMVGKHARALEHYRILAPDLFTNEPEVTRSNGGEAPWVAAALREIGDVDRARRLAAKILELVSPNDDEYDWVYNKHYRMAAHAIAGRDDLALAEFRAAIDQGSRTILFQRFVAYEDAPMFRTLRERPEFRAMVAEIKRHNAEMLADLRERERPAQF